MLGALAACGVPPPVSAPPAAAPAPTDDDNAAPPFDAARIARLAHDAANGARQAEGQQPLAWADSLAPLALGHSADMARRGFFDHHNPDGEDVNARAAHLGLACTYREGDLVYTGFGENLYVGARFSGYRTTRRAGAETTRYDWLTPERLAATALDAWLASPGHRRNLLNPQYRRHAVGVALAGDGRVYFTDVFC